MKNACKTLSRLNFEIKNSYRGTDRMADAKDKIKEGIDEAAKKAKEATDKAAQKASETAKGVGQAVQDAGKKIADTGK
jgi:methyl-accepting chemotaxis protein